MTVLLVINAYAVIAEPQYGGTYSDLEFHKKSGDLSGIELKIIYSEKDSYLLFQSAGGVPSVPVLMKVKIENNYFVVTIPEGTDYSGAILHGIFTEGGINAEFTNGPLSPSGERKFFLERSKSYWD